MSKVWFITGAGSGIGAATARAALKAGDRVVATGRNLDKVRNALSDVAGDNLAFVQLEALLAQSRRHAQRAALAVGEELAQAPGQARAGVVDVVAEDVQFAADRRAGVDGGDLDCRHDPNAGTVSRGERLGDAADGVVVGQGQKLDTAVSGPLHDLCRRELAVGVGGVRLQVEARPGHGAAEYAIASAGARVILAQLVAGRGHELGHVAGDGLAQVEQVTVVAAGLVVQARVGVGGAGLELGVGGVGLGRPLGGLDPEDLQVGERGAELFLGEEVTLLELAQHGQDLVAQPALLGVGAQQKADI